jgi:hypothetical protein
LDRAIENFRQVGGHCTSGVGFEFLPLRLGNPAGRQSQPFLDGQSNFFNHTHNRTVSAEGHCITCAQFAQELAGITLFMQYGQ